MRHMRRNSTLVLVALLGAMPALASSPQLAHAGGLRCSIGEVVIENLKIGHTYSLKTLANLPLTLTNTTDGPVILEVDALVPDASELRQGAEAIPDARWATATPDTMAMNAGETKLSELVLAIPDDERLFGRKFEVIYWSHTLPRPEDVLSYGLKSRIIFTIDPNRDTTDAQPGGDLSLEFVPGELWLDRVSKGRRYDLQTELGQGLTLHNTSSHTLTVDLKTVALTDAHLGISGFGDLLANGEVTLTPATLTLAPGESRAVTGTVQMGHPKQKWTSNLACVISAEVENQPVRTRLYARVYARTQ